MDIDVSLSSFPAWNDQNLRLSSRRLPGEGPGLALDAAARGFDPAGGWPVAQSACCSLELTMTGPIA